MEKITTEKQLVEKIEHCGSCLKDKFALDNNHHTYQEWSDVIYDG